MEATAPWAGAVSRAAAVLYEAGATVVWLFGSRTRGGTTDYLSDFDLGVEGLRGRSLAICQAKIELNGKVDIVRLEGVSAGLRSEILQSRVLVPWVPRHGPAPTARTPLPDNLAGARIRAVSRLIREVEPRSVIDFGCGRGWLLAQLAADGGYARLTGVDFNPRALEEARRRIRTAAGRAPVTFLDLREGLITRRDPVFLGHQAAAAIEVIEHLDPPVLAVFVGVLFQFVRPSRAVITTPNAEYNALWPTLRPRARRHPDHRFEWTRTQFAFWARPVAITYGYEVRFEGVGPLHATCGQPTQLAIFDRRRRD
jgi:SAM-dependent methyltransferase